MKKVGSSHSCTELSKAQFFPVSIVNFTPENCVLCQAVFVGHNSNFTGHGQMSDANIQTCTVAIFHNVKSRFGCVLQFLL